MATPLQRETALEQQQSDAQTDHRGEQRPEGGVGIDEVEPRAAHQPRAQHEDDARDPEAFAHPLGGDADGQGQAQDGNRFGDGGEEDGGHRYVRGFSGRRCGWRRGAR